MGKKIDQLDVYDDVNTDKSRKNLFEVSKNTGTYSSPFYDTDGSRKITQEQLREELNIKEYLVRDFVVIGSGGTILEDKVNAIVVSADESFTLPTASSSNYGKSIVIANRSTYTVTINGIVNGSTIKLTNFNEVIQLSCLFDGTSTYGWWLISDAITDKICTSAVTLASNTHTAKHNENIKADARSIGSDVNITIPTASIEGRLIYVYYPSGSPSSYVVNLIGGFSATLEQLDYFLIRDNGSYWEAISKSQNVSTTPSLDEVTDVGNTTQNSIEVGGLVVDMPSGSGAATSITKGGAGEALTVSKTSGSGNVASFTGGVTSIQEAEITSATANRPAFFDSAKKLVIATGALLGTWFQTLNAKSTPIGADTIVVNDSAASFEAKKTTLTELWTNYLRAFVFSATLTTNRVPKSNGSGILADSNITDNGTTITLGTNTSINGNITMPINGQIDVTGNYLQLGANTSTTGVLIGRSGGDMLFNGTTGGLNFNNGGGINNTANQINYRSSNSVDNGKLDGSTYTMHRGEQCFRHSIVLSPNTQITPNASSQLELASTTKGFLKNRVTTSQKTSISSPANGLNVYDTDLATDSSYTTRGSINAWIDSKIKFSELFDPFLIDQQVSPAGTAYVAVFRPKSDMILTAIEFLVTIFGSSESFYVGIYNQALTSKLSDGTATVSATGFTQISVTPIKLTGATVYYLVLKDNAGGTNSVGCGSSYNNTLICSSKYIGAGALPSNLTTGGSPTVDTKAPYMAVISL